MRFASGVRAVCPLVVMALANVCLAQDPTKATAPASATNPAVPAAGHSVHGEAFNEGPRQKARIMPGMGKIDFKITTDKPDAQAFVNQGVGQLHSFYYFEAERSFRQAAQIDPDCAAAYWGMAMANISNPGRAKGFLKKAKEIAAKKAPSRREQLYIDALEKLYQEGGDDKARRVGHMQAYEVIVQEFPEDLDAKAWLAMITWQNSFQDGIGSRQAVDTLLDVVLAAEPMHPGAHHYRIHLWDGYKPERALKSAALFAPSAPGIAHAWHMPGHTYTALKRYADAAYQQEGSARVDHASMTSERTMPFEIHNYAHNNQWLATSLSHIGRFKDALVVAKNLVEQPRDPNKNNSHDGGSAQRSGRQRWAEILVKYELWDDLIQATKSGILDWSSLPIEQRELHFMLGLAYAAKHDRPALDAEIAALEKLSGDLSKEKNRNEGLVRSLNTAVAELQGQRAIQDGQVELAFQRFSQSPGMSMENLARAHLAARNLGFAESKAKAAADSHVNEVVPMAVYVEILQAVGKSKEAQEVYRTRLMPIARDADPDSPIFQRLAGIVQTWKTSEGWQTPAASTETDESKSHKVDLKTLGPLAWAPFAAEGLELNDTDGKKWSLADLKGKNVVLLFYLGQKCVHCQQQLQVFGKEYEAMKNSDTVVLAISTDDLESSRSLKANKDGVSIPMPILPDPSFSVFKAYRAYDDFESTPLHGTFLIDSNGFVRFQRIGPDPFIDVEFIKSESQRIRKLR